jgi:lipopolysaccharide exporter
VKKSHIIQRTDSTKQALVRGALWALAMRWSVKFIGIVSTAILARFLSPQDYGIIAMAFMVVGFTEAFLMNGTAAALVKIENPDTEVINSAWTLRLIQGLIAALVLATTATWIAQFFKEPKVEQVLWIISAGMAFLAFSNIGITLAYRNLQHTLEYKDVVITKIVSVLCTLGSALYFQDYRALLTGIMFGFLAELFLSYYLHSYRPKWCTSKIHEIWHISKWLLITGMGNFILQRADQITAGRISNTREFGLYTVGADIGNLPTAELGPTITRPLFPILSSLQHDWAQAKSVTLKTLATANTVTIPMGLGMTAVSSQVTMVILGPKWTEAAVFVAGFALIGVVNYLTGPLNTLMNVAGHVKVQTKIVWMEFAVFAVLAMLLVKPLGLVGLMLARLVAGLFHSGYMAAQTSHHMKLPMMSILKCYARPLSGALLMYAMLAHTGAWSNNILLDLCLKVTSGMAFYTVWILATWRMSGMPQGIEATALDFFRSRFPKKVGNS